MEGNEEQARNSLNFGIEKKELYCMLKSIAIKIEIYQSDEDLNQVLIYFLLKWPKTQ